MKEDKRDYSAGVSLIHVVIRLEVLCIDFSEAS